MSPELKIMIQAAKSSGEILKKYFGEPLKITKKSTEADFLTQADLESEKNILKILTRYFPSYDILTEEKGFIGRHSDFIFIIDPLDGSLNFNLGLPTFCVSLGLLRKGKVIFAVIHQPILKETYYAAQESGAFLNGRPLRVNKENQLKKSILGFTCGYRTPLSYFQKIDQALSKKRIKRLMTNWCPTYDYCLLARGKIEAMITFHNQIYDSIPAKLIIREAGGLVTDFKGKPVRDKSNHFLATNGTKIHQDLLKILKNL